MKVFLCIVALAIMPSLGIGQKFDLKIDSVVCQEMERHRQLGVLDIGYTKLGCINFGIHAVAYLFWREGNTTYIQKFEDSEYDDEHVWRSRPIAVSDTVFFPFYRDNGDALSLEHLKPMQVKPNTETIVDHSCYRHFRLYSGGASYNGFFNFYDLEEFDEVQIDNSKLSVERIQELRKMGWEIDTLYKNNPRRNINFEHNSKARIVTWDQLVSKFIKELEAGSPFVELRD